MPIILYISQAASQLQLVRNFIDVNDTPLYTARMVAGIKQHLVR